MNFNSDKTYLLYNPVEDMVLLSMIGDSSDTIREYCWVMINSPNKRYSLINCFSVTGDVLEYVSERILAYPATYHSYNYSDEDKKAWTWVNLVKGVNGRFTLDWLESYSLSEFVDG